MTAFLRLTRRASQNPKPEVISCTSLRLLISIYLSLLALVVSHQPLASQQPRVIGEAYDLQTHALVYTEEHAYPSPYRHTVVYRERTGEAFADKHLDYSRDFTAPDFWQENRRNGEMIQVKKTPQGVLQTHYRRNYQQRHKQASIADLKPMVVDAGFDYYVKGNWDRLLGGQAVNFHYLVPSRLTDVKLSIKQAPCQNNSRSRTCFKISARAWLVKLVLDPIYLSYDTNSKQLMRFTGKSNIADAEGNYQMVDIHYRR